MSSLKFRALTRKPCRQPRKYLASIPLEYLVAIRVAQRKRIQIAFGIVEILPRFRIKISGSWSGAIVDGFTAFGDHRQHLRSAAGLEHGSL
jgi:hypothetical protein